MFRGLNCLKAVRPKFRRILCGSLNRRNLKTLTAKDVKPKSRSEMPDVITERDYKFQEGHIYHGFQCERIDFIADFDLVSCKLRHIDTGTEFWYIDRDDIKNVFSINFRTPPTDSKGTAHVLEHLILLGSHKYPIRLPFFKMLNRSVATTMNAEVATDLTYYVFGSRNEVDFRNLQNVYLDSVFRPNLNYLTFIQEGWRLEHKNLHDRNSELLLKGVVYNEMIGLFAANSRIFRKHLLFNLFPDTAYRFISGGLPLEIPKLKYSEVLEYHRKYYHPSNARIYCYGSFDIMKTLGFIDKKYLSGKGFIDTSYSRIPAHPRWSEPRQIHVQCRMDSLGASPQRQNQIGIASLMCDKTDIQETFELKVLTELLINGPNSAFYKGLIEPNFSGGFNKNTGYLLRCRDAYFLVGLQDLKVENFGKFIELYDQTVRKVIAEGFDPQHIESILHKLELSVRHQGADFGGDLYFNSMSEWCHEGDVVANTRVSEKISKLRNSLKANTNHFQDKVEKYFVDNQHRLTVTMSADESYEKNLKLAEKEMLNDKVKRLTHDDREEIYQSGLKLAAFLKTEEDSDCLPTLTLNDVKEPLKYPTITDELIQGVPTQLCKVPSNGITYLYSFLNTTGLNDDEALLVPLFCDLIQNTDTVNHSFLEFDKLVSSKTTGISFQVKVIENVKDYEYYRTGILMSTHALDKKVRDMFALCNELMLNFRIEDIDRLKMLVKNYISKFSLKLEVLGDRYSMMGAGGLVSNAAKLRSQLTGLEHLDFMKKYTQEHNTEEIRDKLKSIGLKVFNKSNMRVAINCSDSFQPKALEYYKSFLDNLPTLEKMIFDAKLCLLKPDFHHYAMNYPVNYCSKAFYVVPYLHEDHAVLRILTKLIAANYLLPVVRDQNGAYSAGAILGYNGLFTFYSYRDPHSMKTLEAFDNTYKWLQTASEKFDEQMLFEAKLGVLQLLDWPLAPGETGLDYFTLRVSQQEYENYRLRVLSVTIDELRNVVEKYFKNEPKHCGRYILGPKSKRT